MIQRFTQVTTRYIILVISAYCLLACSSMNSQVGGVLNLNTDVKIEFIVDNDINPNESERPSPVYLRLYQLKSDQLFDKTGFIDLYEQDSAKLGDNLVSKSELEPIEPGQSRSEEFILEKDTQYVALFAEFYQYKDAKYKIIAPVTKNNIVRNTLKIKVQGNNLQLIEHNR